MNDAAINNTTRFLWRTRLLWFWLALFYFLVALAWGHWGGAWAKFGLWYVVNQITAPLHGNVISQLAGIADGVQAAGLQAAQEVWQYNPIAPSSTLLIGSAFLAFPLALLVTSFTIPKQRSSTTRHHNKGMQLLNPKDFIKTIKLLNKKNKRFQPGIWIHPDVQLSLDAETEHISVVGTTGAGKTKGLLNYIYSQAYERGDKIVLWDVKGDFTECFAESENVTLIAPWDTRSVAWDIAKDIVRPSDCDMICESAIPDDPRDDKPFRRHARGILSAIMQCLWNEDQLTWEDLYTCIYDKQECTDLLKGYDSGIQVLSYFQDDTPQSQATISTLQDHAGKWIHKAAKAWPNPDFSVRQWLQSDGPGVLLVRYHAEHPDLSGSLCSMTTSLLINQLLTMSEDVDGKRRVWFIMDEMANFPKVGNLKRGFTLARDRGGRFVFSAQDVTQLYPIYGEEMTHTLLNQCNTQIWMRSNDERNSKIASGSLGSKEEVIHRVSANESERGSDYSSRTAGISESYDYKESAVVLPGEIMSLPHVRNTGGCLGFIRVSGLRYVARLKWPLLIFDKQYKNEVPAEWLYAKERRREVA